MWLKHLLLIPPQRTAPAVTGHITDIISAPVQPVIAAAIADGATVLTMQAADTVGAVTFTDLDNARFRISGQLLVRNVAGGALTPAGFQLVTVKAADTRGSAGEYTEQFTIDTYDVPGTISLGNAVGATGQTGTIVSNASSGAQVGTFITRGASGGAIASPLTYLRLTNTKFTNSTDSSGLPSLVRTASGALTAGVDETTQWRVTDGNGITHDETFTISVTDPPAVTVPDRYDELPMPTREIYLVWNLAGNSPTNYGTSGVVVKDGAAGTWKMYSGQADATKNIASLHLGTATTEDDARRQATAAGFPAVTIGHGTVANPYNYIGPWAHESGSIKQDVTIVEYVGYKGTGLIPMGNGPSGVKLWDPPYMQRKQTGQAVDDEIFDLQNGTHGQGKYRIHQVRYGPTREEQAAAKITVFNRVGARTSDECILPAMIRHGNGLALIQTGKQVCITHCECNNSFVNGLHSTKKLRAQRHTGILQIFDSKFTNNGDVNGEHNFYIGDENHVVIAYSFSTLPTGHSVKSDNSMSFEVFENSLSGYRRDYITYGRTSGANGIKVFKGTAASTNYSTIFEAPLRQIPVGGVLDIYSWVDDSDVTAVPPAPMVPYFTDSVGAVNLGNVTVLTSGSAAAGQVVRALVPGTTITTNAATNTAIMRHTFNVADVGRWVRIPGRGFSALRNDTQGGAINLDNSNQDFMIFNNMFHGYHVAPAQTTFVYIQGRHQGGDLRHRKQPPYSWQDVTLANELDLSSVQGAYFFDPLDKNLPAARPPKTYVGFIESIVGTTITITVDFIYSDMFGDTKNVNFEGVGSAGGGPLLADGTTVYDIELRCDNGTVDIRTITLTTFVAKLLGSGARYTATLSAVPSFTVTGNANDKRNVIVFKRSAASGGNANWDRIRMDAPAQSRWFNRADPNYYPRAVTRTTGNTMPNGQPERILDFTKQEPSVSGLIDGIPFGYVNNNLLIPLLIPDLTELGAYKKSSIVQSLNAYLCTKFWSNGTTYEVRLADPPQNSSDGVTWANNAAYGNFDLRLSTHPVTSVQLGGPMFASEATDGFGPRGTDMIRFNAVVLKENGIFDLHLPSNATYEAAGNVGNNSADDSLYNSSNILPNLSYIPNNPAATPVDVNGVTPFTIADKASFPAGYDRGKPMIVIGPYGSTGGTVAIMVGAAFVNRCRVQAIDPVTPGAPVIGDRIQLEVDTQFGVGEGVHNALITAVTTISATVFDIIFSPGLPQPGDADPIFGTVALGREKGLSVNTAIDTYGGRGVFMKPARTPLPSWWLNNTDIPD